MPLLIDTHVHLYPQQSWEEMCEYAYSNMSRICRERGWGGVDFVLCLLETTQFASFEGLKAVCINGPTGGPARDRRWSVCSSRDSLTLKCIRESDGATLWIVRGQQIITRERLEVLLLGSEERGIEGCPIGEVISKGISSGAVAVLPWSPGKWLGERGRVVKAEVARLLGSGHNSLPIFVGDICMKPLRVLEGLATRCGIFSGGVFEWLTGASRTVTGSTQLRTLSLLAGSDPLPLPGDSSLIGSFATVVEGELSEDSPAASVIKALIQAGASLVHAGKPASLPHAITRQIRQTLRKKVENS